MGQAHAGRYEIEKRFDGQKILFIDTTWKVSCNALNL